MGMCNVKKGHVFKIQTTKPKAEKVSKLNS